MDNHFKTQKAKYYIVVDTRLKVLGSLANYINLSCNFNPWSDTLSPTAPMFYPVVVFFSFNFVLSICIKVKRYKNAMLVKLPKILWARPFLVRLSDWKCWFAICIFCVLWTKNAICFLYFWLIRLLLTLYATLRYKTKARTVLQQNGLLDFTSKCAKIAIWEFSRFNFPQTTGPFRRI